jgi:hypothetical protein
MNCVPIDFRSSDQACAGLARRILTSLLAEHKLDSAGLMGTISDALANGRTGLANDKSRGRFIKRLHKSLGARLLRVRFFPARPVRESVLTIRAFGLGETSRGVVIRGCFASLALDGNAQAYTEFEITRHALERAVMRAGLRNQEDLITLVDSTFDIVRAMVSLGSNEIEKSSGRIFLPPLIATGDGETQRVVPVFCREERAVLTFLPVGGKHSALGAWASQFSDTEVRSGAWFDERMRESEAFTRRHFEESAA